VTPICEVIAVSARPAHRPRRALLAALLASLTIATAACGDNGAAAPPPDPAPTQSAASLPATVVTPPAQAAPSADVAAPVRIQIPAIGVDAEIVPVGLNEDESMETPDFGLAGYYTEGPRPGAPGPSVVVAHVDSQSGPDVFYNLRELVPGDEITITREDGTTGTWFVVSQEQTDKDELPVERIWNDTEQAVLRLITCGGEFDDSIGHYEDNITVYADPSA
jgi:sortase (surface protein transpeptidase)